MDAEALSDVLALGDGMDGEVWFRAHSRLVTSGLWARLKPCSRSVYIVLSAAADRRKRCTIIGVEKVAQRAGLSVPRVLFAYRELKDHGLIRRRRVRLGEYRPYLTVLLSPRMWGLRPAGTPGSHETRSPPGR
jgi:hypothetical protein